ncbi:MAG TPA: efflux RND transporter periplasmic adaptor subunit [Vicinamibacterales bacterium]|jgi:HlyD family secretion protein|nr:efflux RND transporter periplasmic adaptor subunit [Vicinamibacterales bacterium]
MRLWKNARLLVIGLIVAAIAAVALWPEAIEVDVARAVRGPLRVTIDEEGQTRVHERFVVAAPVAGRLLRVELEPGDAVVRGKTVVVRVAPTESPLLDPRTRAELMAAVEAARAVVAQARADHDRAAATLEQARRSLERQESLVEAGAIAREDLEDAQTAAKTAEGAFRAAQAAVARAEQELRLAQARLQTPPARGRVAEVVAPVNGVILKRLRESETVVPAGEPLLEIGDPRQLEVVADLLSTDAVRVPPGSPVSLEQWGGGQPLHGRVRRVEPSGFTKVSALGVEEQRVNVIIDFAEPAAAIRALGDSYRVEVRIVIWEAADVVKVPVGSLFRRGNDWAVFVVNDNHARLQVVELGQRNNEEGQILRGVEAGQAIVLHPPDTLTDGARVAERAR